MTLAQPRTSRWVNAPDLEMLLLFAQALEELLFDYTIDSFKARALNLHTSLMELRSFAVRVRRGRFNSGAIIPLIEEITDKIKTDPILGARERAVFAVYADRLENDRTKLDVLIRLIDAMILELGDFYWERLLAAIPEAVSTPKNSKVVLALADTFVSEAELQGFHRSFIYHAAKRYFWGQPIRATKDIDGFLNLFREDPKHFSFVFRVNEEFMRLGSVLDAFNTVVSDTSPVTVGAAKSNVNVFLGSKPDYPLYATVTNITQRDGVSARLVAENRLEMLASIYSYHFHQGEPKWVRPCLAVELTSHDQSLTEGATRGLINPPVSAMKRQARTAAVSRGDPFEKVLEVLRGMHFGAAGSRSFFKALDYHRAAMEVAIPENQLISLWAALEGFLPPPDPETNRISHYVGTLLPALTLTYPEKLFDYVTRTLTACDKSVADLVRNAFPGEGLFSATVGVLTAEECAAERTQLYAMLAHNPLLRWRCFSLNAQFNSAKHVLGSVKDHKTRVAWHLQRIYSTRNQIVHSAESLPYLSTLVENLHSYIDTLLDGIATVGRQAKRVGSVEGALALLSVQDTSYVRELSSRDEAVTRTNYKTLVFGSTNPLSPFNERLSL
jgi:hypothetical protein